MISQGSNRLVAMVPCQLMKATIEVKDPSSLSPLHLMTLRAIAEHGNLKAILEAFGVGRRVMQGILADLFYAGFVYLNLRDGKAVVAPHVTESLKAGNLEELLSIHAPREVEMVWVREMVSGGLMVYPLVSKYLDRPDFASATVNLVPKPGVVASLKDLPVRSLAKAAAPILQDQVPTRAPVIEQVERITNRRLVGVRTFYVPVSVLRPKADEDPILLPEVRGVPRAITDAWTAMLNPKKDPLELVTETRVDTDPIRTLSPKGLAADWAGTVSRLRAASHLEGQLAGNDAAGELVDHLGDIARLITQVRLSAESVTVIAGPPEHHFTKLAEILQDARSSVLIGSAFLNPERLGEIVPLVAPAVKRGAKVALVWGLADADGQTVEPGLIRDAQRIVESLSQTIDREKGGGIWLVPSESPFHSKFVAIDGKVALISSLNWLSTATHGDTWEVTAVLKEGTLPQDVFSYGVEHLPSDGAVRQAVGQIEPVEPGPSPWVDAAARIAESFTEASSPEDSYSERESALDEAEALTRNILDATTASLVRDGEHRRMLTSALASAQKRFVVTSDRVRTEGAGHVFARLSREALTRGVNIMIRWGRAFPGTRLDEDTQESINRAGELKEDLGVGFDINDQPIGIHGKVVVVDGQFSLISSFNFLSFGGVASRERTLSGELGLAIFDESVARALETSLDVHASSVRSRTAKRQAAS